MFFPVGRRLPSLGMLKNYALVLLRNKFLSFSTCQRFPFTGGGGDGGGVPWPGEAEGGEEVGQLAAAPMQGYLVQYRIFSFRKPVGEAVVGSDSSLSAFDVGVLALLGPRPEGPPAAQGRLLRGEKLGRRRWVRPRRGTGVASPSFNFPRV